MYEGRITRPANLFREFLHAPVLDLGDVEGAIGIDGDVVGTLERLHDERGAWYREVADVTVAVEPAHRTEHPKRALAEQVTELVLAHEAEPRLLVEESGS